MDIKSSNKSLMKVIGNVYHYTDIKTIPLILKDDGIHLRMTHVEHFQDKHEGRKTIEIYYDLALERLLHDGIIERNAYEALSTIEVPEKKVFIFPSTSLSKNISGVVSNSSYDAFIACFSYEKNSEYMFENYIKNDTKAGYCMEFPSPQTMCSFLNKGIDSGYRIQYNHVLYGEETIQYIYNRICALKEEYGSFDEKNIYTYLRAELQCLLSELRFTAKLHRYHNEKEIRLVLFIPKNEDITSDIIYKNSASFSGKDCYIYIKLPKSAVCRLHRSKNVTDDENAFIRNTIADIGYQIRSENLP